MDLAISLGAGSFESLAGAMTEREFSQWATYARKRMLPMKRLELYLARICMLIDSAWGGGQGKDLHDYLLDDLIGEQEVDEEIDVGADFGFNPRFKK